VDELRSRREFLVTAVQTAGSAVLASSVGQRPAESSERAPLPRRTLGRTGVKVSVIGLGLASLGMAGYSPEEFQAVVQTAIDEGVSYLDMQPNYGEAERLVAPVLRKNRDQLFVVTKTWEKSKQDVMGSIAGSLDRLGVPSIDAVLLNNIGGYDLNALLSADGAVAGLREARRRGQVRFLGLSGHYRPGHFKQALETGEFDIVMAPFNFVDRHLYAFEHDILPAAAKCGAGIVAMKVLGGAVDLKYDTRDQRAMLPVADHPTAIRYVLGLPQLSCAVIGCKNAEEVRSAAVAGRRYLPLGESEMVSLLARGKDLSERWGTRYPGD
jgi:aryl-alcohol dehydrogenase-like predicted oxidoreductase